MRYFLRAYSPTCAKRRLSGRSVTAAFFALAMSATGRM
jgi:hypothetical protein